MHYHCCHNDLLVLKKPLTMIFFIITPINKIKVNFNFGTVFKSRYTLTSLDRKALILYPQSNPKMLISFYNLTMIGFIQVYKNWAVQLTLILKLTNRDAWRHVLYHFTLKILVLIIPNYFSSKFWDRPPHSPKPP